MAVLALAALLLGACGSVARLPAVPEGAEARAVVGDLEGVRYFVSTDLEVMREDGIEAYQREIAWRESQGMEGPLPPAHFLAISGGGENGAYGAGLINGWTASGTRPEFKLVTGVSTGALSAPFAFLGPDWDDELRAVYTEISAADVLRSRGVFAALWSDAMADNAPLRATIAGYVDAAFLEAIAAESRKGRLLLIGTTNIDARRGVIWNIGKIAEQGGPGAVDLVIDLLVASAAIPGAFPPSMIDVTVDGVAYQEMHVDGGASAQVFVYPPSLHLQDLAKENDAPQRERHVWVIRNARLDPDWSDTERQVMSIAQRAISSLIQTQGVGDLYRIYATTQRDGVDFNLAYIPASFDLTPAEPFEQAFMRALYEVGYGDAEEGYAWQKAPPGL